MVTYGPWLQAPDFQRTPPALLSLDRSALDNLDTSVESRVFREGGPYTGSQAEVDAVVAASADSGWLDDPDRVPLFDPFLGYPVLFRLNRIGVPHLDGESVYSAQRRFDPVPFTAWAPDPDAGPWPSPVNSNPGVDAPEWPSGAITYEYEEPYATAVASSVRVSVTPTDFDDTNIGTTVMHNGDGVQQIRATTGTFAPDNPATYPERSEKLVGFDGRQAQHTGVLLDEYPTTRGVAVERTVDTTSAMFGGPHDGFVVLMGSYRVDRVPTIHVDDIDGQGFGMGVGNGGISEITYTLRPARHRFVFARRPGLPPTRVFPRDDGLAASAGPRVWPPPKSQQGGGRVGPGSYW